jgi:hypothetical protein
MDFKFLGKLMMLTAFMGHFFTHKPQPMQRSSEIQANLLVLSTSIQILPILTTGQLRLHSCLHLRGLHFSVSTMAMRSGVSSSFPFRFWAFFFGGMVQILGRFGKN